MRLPRSQREAPIELRIYPGADGAFTLYEDEGDNYDYEHGAYSIIPIRWEEKTHTLTIGVRKGSFPGMPSQRVFNIVWVSHNHGNGIAPTADVDRTITYRGSEVRISSDQKGSGK